MLSRGYAIMIILVLLYINGYFTEMFFPQNDVRFIAINDNVDSSEGYNDFAPFKNLINEWYEPKHSLAH